MRHGIELNKVIIASSGQIGSFWYVQSSTKQVTPITQWSGEAITEIMAELLGWDRLKTLLSSGACQLEVTSTWRLRALTGHMAGLGIAHLQKQTG